MIKIINLKLGMMQEYKNIKTFLQEVTHQISQKKFLLLKKIKRTWAYAIEDINDEEIVGTFYEKES